MQRVWLHIRRQDGFSPVEALLAATVFGMVVVAIVGAIIFGRTSTATSGERQRATLLAEEGVEAVRNMRDAAYTNLADGTYGLAKSGNVWTLSGSSDTTGIFTRSVTISAVDTGRKTVTANVSWPYGTTSSQVSVSSRLTNWTSSIASWANGVVAGGYDAAGTTNGYEVATQGNYAYLIRNSSGVVNFLIIDISNTAAPTLLGSLTLPNTPTNVAVSGNYAYVSNSSTAGELQIINVTNPAAPSLAATYNAPGTGGGGLSVVVKDTNVYLGRAANLANGEITVVNVATPTAPTLVGKYNNNISINELVISGNYLYAATNSLLTDMLVVDISNPASPTPISEFNTLTLLTATTGVSVSGNRAYLVAGSLVMSVDITNPYLPIAMGTYTLAGSGAGTDVQIDDTGGYLFVGSANTTAELRILNVSNPAAMMLTRTIDVSGTASTVNGVAYNTGLGVALGASYSDTQELVIFKKN